MEKLCKWAYICLVDDWGECKEYKVKYSRNAMRQAFIVCIINIILQVFYKAENMPKLVMC